jgi:hypothetical protein
MYRRRSGIALSNTYPAKSKLAAPATFVIVDNARITRPSFKMTCRLDVFPGRQDAKNRKINKIEALSLLLLVEWAFLGRCRRASRPPV